MPGVTRRHEPPHADTVALHVDPGADVREDGGRVVEVVVLDAFEDGRNRLLAARHVDGVVAVLR